MILKERTESEELLVLRILNTRMELSDPVRFHYINLERGFEGEKKFDDLAECLEEERYVINDLLLELNGSHYQIDTVIISQGGIHLIDTKYHQGDWVLESDKLFLVAGHREYKNPVHQLKRCTTLFNQLLQKHKQNYLVDASIVFVHPEFTLYQAPLDLPIILPTQIPRFFRDINKTPSKLNDGHRKLAQLLISLHQTKNPYTKLPEYTYDQIRKGLTCKNCNSFSMSVVGRHCICNHCDHKELALDAVMRSVQEFKLLFPERDITTNAIYDWCKVIPKKRIRFILSKNFKMVGIHQWSTYV